MILSSVSAVSVGEAIAGAGVVVDFFSLASDMYDRWKAANPDVPDSEYPGFGGGTFGGGAGRPSPEEFAAAYTDYVNTLPATGYTSAGKLLWQPTIADLPNPFYYTSDPITLPLPYSCKSDEYEINAVSNSQGNGFTFTFKWLEGSGRIVYEAYEPQIIAPLSGTFTIKSGPGGSGSIIYVDGTRDTFAITHKGGQTLYCNSGELLKFDYYIFYKHKNEWIYKQADFLFPTFEVIPVTAPSADTYNTTTRPTSITGGNYGVVGDNNEITKVEDNSTIINETNNTYYNPATGTTVPITDWSYNYTDRSYKVTTESGDTATITYGDENISIQETNTTSGDTVTNNYTIYYLVEGSGEPPADPPATCTHNWTETSMTPATCTVPGSKLLTCSLCSQTKTESIPALGHDWETKQTVTTQYDETGQLTQQGYTVFECGTCHEQYKSEDGALPPAVTPGTGTDLAAVDALKEKLKIAADALLGIFDKLPELFTGFTDFLAAVFPFVPTEFITIFELGLFLLIAAAALRKFLS